MLKPLAILAGAVAGCALLTAGPLYAASSGSSKMPYDVKVRKTAHGEVLTDAKGMTLYTFAKDSKGMSNCTGGCASNWPPLKADDSDKPVGEFTVIKRSDGGMQWAYDGKPLYRFKQDKKPGQAMGDGKGGVWHVAK